jgi:hypothetical protein
MLTETPNRTIRGARLVAAAALAALTLLAVAPASQAKVPKTFYGVVPQTSLGAADFERMGQAKVGVMRVPMFWTSIDPTSAPNDLNWASFDATVGGAAQNGVEILPFIFGTPDWVAKDLDGLNCGTECGTHAPKSQAALDAWSQFVSAAVARYGQGGTFWAENPGIPAKPISAWQLWNEQNSNEFFAPKAKPKAYAKLLSAGADAVRAADGSADVVLGGMAELAGSRKATKGSKYLKKLYKVKGVKSDFDGVAIHPYGSKVEKAARQVDTFREIMAKGKDKRAGLWITELGWSSEKGGNPLNRGPKGQADRLKEAFKYFRKQRRKQRIETINWFSWADSPTSICDWCAKSGLLDESLGTKPAYKAFTKFTGGR